MLKGVDCSQVMLFLLLFYLHMFIMTITFACFRLSIVIGYFKILHLDSFTVWLYSVISTLHLYV